MKRRRCAVSGHTVMYLAWRRSAWLALFGVVDPVKAHDR